MTDEESAIIIQKTYRGYKERKDLSLYKKSIKQTLNSDNYTPSQAILDSRDTLTKHETINFLKGPPLIEAKLTAKYNYTIPGSIFYEITHENKKYQDKLHFLYNIDASRRCFDGCLALNALRELSNNKNLIDTLHLIFNSYKMNLENELQKLNRSLTDCKNISTSISEEIKELNKISPIKNNNLIFSSENINKYIEYQNNFSKLTNEFFQINNQIKTYEESINNIKTKLSVLDSLNEFKKDYETTKEKSHRTIIDLYHAHMNISNKFSKSDTELYKLQDISINLWLCIIDNHFFEEIWDSEITPREIKGRSYYSNHFIESQHMGNFKYDDFVPSFLETDFKLNKKTIRGADFSKIEYAYKITGEADYDVLNDQSILDDDFLTAEYEITPLSLNNLNTESSVSYNISLGQTATDNNYNPTFNNSTLNIDFLNFEEDIHESQTKEKVLYKATKYSDTLLNQGSISGLAIAMLSFFMENKQLIDIINKNNIAPTLIMQALMSTIVYALGGHNFVEMITAINLDSVEEKVYKTFKSGEIERMFFKQIKGDKIYESFDEKVLKESFEQAKRYEKERRAQLNKTKTNSSSSAPTP